MPIKVRALGEEVSIMRIGRRQLRLRGPRKRDKPLMVIKSKSVPSRTIYWLQAAINFAEAAREMRGHTLEEVVQNIIKKCAGKTYVPEEVKRARLEARWEQADENIRRMKEELEWKLYRKRMAEERKGGGEELGY